MVAELSTSELTRFQQAGIEDRGTVHFQSRGRPTDFYRHAPFPIPFSAEKKYPLLVSVYAGPATTGAAERFTLPNTLTEFGFLVRASIPAAPMAAENAAWMPSTKTLAWWKSMTRPPGLNCLRGGGMWMLSGSASSAPRTAARLPCSACCVTQVFHAACASSPVTDFRNYDTIYTERYLGLPQENKEAYDAASVRHAASLKGRLMLYYGTADDNVHPSNALQLVRPCKEPARVSTAGRPGCRPCFVEPRPDDGVFHREPHPPRAVGNPGG